MFILSSNLRRKQEIAEERRRAEQAYKLALQRCEEKSRELEQEYEDSQSMQDAMKAMVSVKARVDSRVKARSQTKRVADSAPARPKAWGKAAAAVQAPAATSVAVEDPSGKGEESLEIPPTSQGTGVKDNGDSGTSAEASACEAVKETETRDKEGDGGTAAEVPACEAAEETGTEVEGDALGMEAPAQDIPQGSELAGLADSLEIRSDGASTDSGEAV